MAAAAAIQQRNNLNAQVCVAGRAPCAASVVNPPARQKF
jgi:hypothetical protein